MVNDGANATSLIKSGTGSWVLTGANTYSGTTAINAGKLTVIGSLANTAVTVAGGATLSGTGTIGTSAGGGVTVAGGTSAGTIGTIDLRDNAVGALTLNTISGANALTLGGITAGNYSDLWFDMNDTNVDVINLGAGGKLLVQAGGAKINLNQLAGTTLANGVYNLITFDNGNGVGLNMFSLGSVPAGYLHAQVHRHSPAAYRWSGHGLLLDWRPEQPLEHRQHRKHQLVHRSGWHLRRHHDSI